ncbi:hypothetical protein HYALB_00002708 [Hymenoscyphus albidus]|uniref:Uncharacterized protein n=1 Tax=Hymenoscyphus albidus TaxID=595503 RepID=A0A9N9M539_9HELO|nr:hypothetical protein HYALB_00002708 [Hymenoscyphus albidus]
MSSSGHFHEEVIKNPHALTDRDLWNMRLKDVSDKLPLTTSVRTTMEFYLRWLEVHRTRPTSKTNSWENTIWQWAQSLRRRGIREGELIRSIRDWKEDNGPFPVTERRPPRTKDIEKAFDDPALPPRKKDEDLMTWKRADPATLEPAPRRQDHHSMHSDRVARIEREREESRERRYHDHGRESGDSYESKKMYPFSSKQKPSLEAYLQPPPPSYVCNRCHKRGKHLPSSPIRVKFPMAFAHLVSEALLVQTTVKAFRDKKAKSYNTDLKFLGHHLQSCPTNMNPEFDKPPDDFYVCSICMESGLHYKSLCPRNCDPYSIIQRRRHVGYSTPGMVAESSVTDPRRVEELITIRENDRKHVESFKRTYESGDSSCSQSPSSSKKQEQKDELKRIEEMRSKLSKEEIEEVFDFGYAGIGKLSLTNQRKRALSDTSAKSRDSQNSTPTRKKNRNFLETPYREIDSDTYREVEELILAERGPPRSSPPLVYQQNPDELQLDDDSQSSHSPRATREETRRIVIKFPSPKLKKSEYHKMMETNTPEGDKADRNSTCGYSPYPRGDPDDMVLDNNSPDSMNASVYYTPKTPPVDSAAVKSVRMSPYNSDSCEEGQIFSAEATEPPKYSQFVENLIFKYPEMKIIRNPITKRPNAVDMWEQESQCRKTPRESSDRMNKRTIAQFDGACDEIPVEKSNRRRKYKLGNLGKSTFGRVKDAAKEFPKLGGRSKSRPLTNQTEPLISRSPTPPSPCPKDDEHLFPQRPPNIPRVMVTSLPSNFREKELPKLPDTKTLSMQAGNLWTETNSSTDLDESKLLNQSSTPRSPSELSTPSTRWDSRRSIHNSSVFSKKSSSRDPALSEARSTNEFRSTVRKIIEESKSEDPIRSQSQDNLQLSNPTRAKILRTMSDYPATSEPLAETMNGAVEKETRKEVQIKKATCSYNRQDLDAIAAAKNAKRREKTFTDLKQFAGAFKLETPVPEEIAKLYKLEEGNEQNVNHDVKENGAKNGMESVERQN